MSYLSAFLALLFGLMAIPAHADEADESPESMGSPPVKERVMLSHSEALVRIYQPQDSPRAIMVFGSGDGGWSPWEDVVAGWLRDAGVCVAGFDFREYAAKDYDRKTLCKDMAAVAAHVAGRIGGESLPVIYGGWSMGASQAVAAAGPARPAKLAGLLLMSTDHRGRPEFRCRWSDSQWPACTCRAGSARC